MPLQWMYSEKGNDMAKMKDIMIVLQEEINKGELTLEQIAVKYDVPMDWVDTAFGEVVEQEYMSGDFWDDSYDEEDE